MGTKVPGSKKIEHSSLVEDQIFMFNYTYDGVLYINVVNISGKVFYFVYKRIRLGVHNNDFEFTLKPLYSNMY